MIPRKIFLLEVTDCFRSKLSLHVKPNMLLQQPVFLPQMPPLAKHSRCIHPGNDTSTLFKGKNKVTPLSHIPGAPGSGSKLFPWVRLKLPCTSNDRSASDSQGRAQRGHLPFEGKTKYFKEAVC